MIISKLITMSFEEVNDAISEYLARRDIAFNVESITIVNVADEDEEVELAFDIIAEVEEK